MNFKKLALLFALSLGLILVVFFGVQKVVQGKLEVSTNSKTSTIKIVKSGTDTAKEADPSKVISLSKGAVSISVAPGTYLVAVEDGDKASSKAVVIERGKTTSVNISPIKTTPVEPVSDTGAKSIIASQAHAYYLDPVSRNLFSITSDNKIHSVNPALQFSSVQWADSTYGVGQGISGRLYEISNGSVAVLATQIPVSYISETNYAVAPSHQLYVAFNNGVYRSNPASGLQKIYTADSSARLVASSNGVAVISSGGVESAAKNVVAAIAVIDLQGAVSKKDIGVYEIALSPDGKQVATSNDFASTLYDSKLHEIASIPAVNISSLVWLDNKTLLYAVDNQLWRYDSASKIAERIANMPDKGAISGISPSDLKDYVYVAAEHGYNKPVIKRVALQGQAFDETVNRLQDIMPIITNDYLMAVVNFSQPTVFVQPTAYANIGTYAQAAIEDLKARGINIDKVHLVFGQTN